MARNRGNRRPVRRNVRRRAKPQKKRQVSGARLPPAKGLLGNVFRSVVQTAWDIAQGVLSHPVHGTYKAAENPRSIQVLADNGYLLAQGWLDKYKKLFSEMKVHKVTAYYMPYASIQDPGLYIFSIAESGTTLKVQQEGVTLVGSPGSVVRRMSQTAKRVWYPTEPSDKEWLSLNSDHKWLVYTIQSAEKAYYVPEKDDKAGNKTDMQPASLAGKIIVDVDASFRGEGVDNVKAMEPCFCGKCSKVRAKEEFERSQLLRDGFEMLQS